LNENVTYGDLNERADRIARALLGLGGTKGDRVILAGDNSPFWTVAYLGIVRAGLVAVPLPAGISTKDLSYILQSTEATIVFSQRSFAARNASALGMVHVVTDKEAGSVPTALSQTNDFGSGSRPAGSPACSPVYSPG